MHITATPGFRKGFQGKPEKSELMERNPFCEGHTDAASSRQTEIPVSTDGLKEVFLKHRGDL